MPKFKELREERGLQAKQVAEQAGVSRPDKGVLRDTGKRREIQEVARI